MSLDLEGIEADYVKNAINKRTLTQEQQDMVDETINVLDNIFHPNSRQRKQMLFFVQTMVKSVLLAEDVRRGL